MKKLFLLSALLLAACSTGPEIVSGKGAIYGVLSADAHKEFRKKADSGSSAGPYGSPKSGIVYKDNMMNYSKLDDLYVGLVQPEFKLRQHRLFARESGMSKKSLALALGDELHIHNNTAQPQNFFITTASDEAFQSFPELAAGDNASYKVNLEGELELLSEDSEALKMALFVKKNMQTRRVRSGGKYQFEQLSPGMYSLVFWHWRLGKIRQDVQVQAGENTRVDGTLSIDRVMQGH